MENLNLIQRNIESRRRELEEEIINLKSIIQTYDVCRGRSYNHALSNLNYDHNHDEAKLQPEFTKKDGTRIVRPLTFEETIEARVITETKNKNIFEYLGFKNRRIHVEYKPLFEENLLTSSGIIFKNESKLKIIPLSEELISITDNFKSNSIIIKYEDIYGIELEVDKLKSNEYLTKSEALNHPLWNELVPDKSLLRAYNELIYNRMADPDTCGNVEVRIGFRLPYEIIKDQLYPLAVTSFLNDSYIGNGSMIDETIFAKTDLKLKYKEVVL